MRTSISPVLPLTGRDDLHINGIISTDDLIDRIGYSTNTLLQFKLFQHPEILGNEFGVYVKGSNKLFHEAVDEVQRIRQLTNNVLVR